jgi:hypothetical protein
MIRPRSTDDRPALANPRPNVIASSRNIAFGPAPNPASLGEQGRTFWTVSATESTAARRLARWLYRLLTQVIGQARREAAGGGPGQRPE